MSVLIVDYGMGNLGSVRRSVEECGASAFCSSDPNDTNDVTHIILPGVGSFADGMKNLIDGGWIPSLKKSVFEDKIPLLGICLGMQLLSDKGYENGESIGLGYIAGEVIELKSDESERIPHMGWNELAKTKESSLFNSIPNNSDFYFDHSFRVIQNKNLKNFQTCEYGTKFVASFERDNIYGTQFHPEKSQSNGLTLMYNFLNN